MFLLETLHQLPNTAIEVEITEVEESCFEWRIPSFPLICLHFRKLKFLYNGIEYYGLVKQEENISIGMTTCPNNHTIILQGKNYIVLWEPITIQHTTEAEHESDDLVDVESGVMHTLLFKVLGVCHSVERQKTLERAYQLLYEYNRPVFSKLEKEPDNVYDSNAIAVYVMTDDSYDKVGYIASELTQFVHPYLNTPDFNVSVEKVTFCTKYLLVGFYLTISLSKKGLWHNEVIKASKKVK